MPAKKKVVPGKPVPTKRAQAKRARIAGSPARGVIEKLRKICLALPDATEVEAWGHPTFRINDKIFAGCGADESDASMSVKTTHDMQAALVASDPRFSIAAYVGKHGWVSMKLDGKIDWGEVDALVRGSYDLVAAGKASAKTRSKTPSVRRSRAGGSRTPR